MRLAARLCLDPLGSFSAPPHLLVAFWGGVLLLRGREGRGIGQKRERESDR